MNTTNTTPALNVVTATSAGQTMTTTKDFIASLPPALTRRGSERASDATLAKRIRNELQLAVTRGVFPEDTRFSVRIEHHSSLTVEIVEWHGGALYNDEYTTHLMDPSAPEHQHRGRGANSHFSPAMGETLRSAEAIADRHNYDESDLQADYFNVGYYLTVGCRALEAATRASIAAEINPGFAELREAARLAAAAVGPKVTKSLLGRSGLEGASEYRLKCLVKVAARAAGRPLAYDKKRRGWFPVEAAPSGS